MRTAVAPLEGISQRYERMRPHLNERQRRLWAGSEALAIGHGGLMAVTDIVTTPGILSLCW